MHRRCVDMAADDSVHVLAAGLGRQRVLEAGDARRAAPGFVAPPSAPADHRVICQHGRRIDPDAERGQPPHPPQRRVEPVAMHHQVLPSVGAVMDRLADHLDPAQPDADGVAQELVVVAGHVQDARSVLLLSQQAAHDVVVRAWPVPARLEAPAVDHVADQVDQLGIAGLQQVEQAFGLAVTGAEMQVGDEQCANPHVASARRSIPAIAVVSRVSSPSPVRRVGRGPKSCGSTMDHGFDSQACPMNFRWVTVYYYPVGRLTMCFA